jgi:hypothetical protein
MLDSPEGVCAGQVRFEYPATSVLLSLVTGSFPVVSTATTRPAPAYFYRVSLPTRLSHSSANANHAAYRAEWTR